MRADMSMKNESKEAEVKHIDFDKKYMRVLRVILPFIAAGMMAYGIYRGEMAVVLAKATRICMECIGIG